MTDTDRTDRTDRWLADLTATLDRAALLVERGEAAYRTDPALPLAFEALSDRVGEIAKRLTTADPNRFGEPIWRQAARNRDFLAHHYDRVDHTMLWETVTVSFPLLRNAVRRAVASPQSSERTGGQGSSALRPGGG